ncbi:MAG: hypothetical protein CO099_12535 [Bdellovibrio sp. CG_4_9_14_3_um_filter_39_7]|nr:MAG: hypothetical protein CO099_12535 [Bdellovibrio sp. CG_4_9_14_3_um_filter_39_7]
MRKGILVAALLASGWIGATQACDMHGTSGIVEQNDLWISTSDKAANNMTEARFNEIINNVEAIYSPIISTRGKQLEIERKWDDGTVNAYAQQVGNVWKVSMFGGLARHQVVTDDAFALVVCHELGHHLGGQPKKKSWWGSSWASNEGQADYFGNSKCLRKYMEKDDNIAIVASLNVPDVATKACQESFTNASDIAMCQRGAMAELSLADLFKALRNSTTPLKFDTPDTKVVTATNDNHPDSQCRLDTYFNGALCDKDAYTDPSDTDAVTGYCVRADGYTSGVRPLCWYKP